jgi:hypothetical protein
LDWWLKSSPSSSTSSTWPSPRNTIPSPLSINDGYLFQYPGRLLRAPYTVVNVHDTTVFCRNTCDRITIVFLRIHSFTIIVGMDLGMLSKTKKTNYIRISFSLFSRARYSSRSQSIRSSLLFKVRERQNAR